jgi:hypothetical protein
VIGIGAHCLYDAGRCVLGLLTGDGSCQAPAGGLGVRADLVLLLDGLERPGYPLNGRAGAPSLHGRIATELPRFLTTGETPFATWHNGAYVLGSFPCYIDTWYL